MKVAEYWKLLEAKAIEVRDLLNSLLKLTTSTYHGVFTVEDILKRPSLAGTTLDWEFRADKRRHVAVLYTEYLKLSTELQDMLSVEVNYPRDERVEAMSWIRCVDHLPITDMICWVVLKKTREVMVCCFNAHYKYWDDESGEDFMHQGDEVSHWQPYIIPAPPREEQMEDLNTCRCAEEGVHEGCCIHDRPSAHECAPGQIRCWCGDI